MLVTAGEDYIVVTQLLSFGPLDTEIMVCGWPAWQKGVRSADIGKTLRSCDYDRDLDMT